METLLFMSLILNAVLLLRALSIHLKRHYEKQILKLEREATLNAELRYIDCCRFMNSYSKDPACEKFIRNHENRIMEMYGDLIEFGFERKKPD